MISEAMIVYESGGLRIPLAIISCSGDRIDYRLCEDCAALPFGERERDEIVRDLIELPLKVWTLRHKTMPQLFDEVLPGSDEHFTSLLSRSYGPFTIEPITINN